MSITTYSIFDRHFIQEGNYDDAISDEFYWDFFVEYAQRTEFTYGELLESIKKNDPDLFYRIYEEALELFKEENGAESETPENEFQELLEDDYFEDGDEYEGE